MSLTLVQLKDKGVVRVIKLNIPAGGAEPDSIAIKHGLSDVISNIEEFCNVFNKNTQHLAPKEGNTLRETVRAICNEEIVPIVLIIFSDDTYVIV